MIRAPIKYLVVHVLAYVLAGCGTLVGNPKQPQDSTQTTPKVVVVPELNFVLPSSVLELGGEEDSDSSLRLAAQNFMRSGIENPKFTLLHGFSYRADRIVKSIEKAVKFLKSERIESTGQFSSRGSDRKISGYIAEISDEVYTHEFVLCHDDQPVMHMQFDEPGKHIRATKDFSKAPVGEALKAQFISEIVIDTKDEASQLRFRTNGAFPQSSSRLLRYDGTEFVEAMSFTKLASGDFTLSGVNDWRSSGSSDPFEGDGYIVGRIAADGSGESVGYRKASSIACRGGFDEGASDLFDAIPRRGQPGWCFAQAIGAEQEFSDVEVLEALQRLKEIGLTKKSELSTVKMNPDLSCTPPAE
jgi:hypothetical protein